MKVTVEDLSTVKKKLNIEIPEEDVTKELDDAYRALKKNAKIKGFRPGKAPRSVLERLFKKDVHSDIVSKLLQNSFIDALRENDLNPVGTPKIDPPDLVAGEAYCYDAIVEITPEIGDIDFKGLELKKRMYKVSDGEVDAQLKMLQKNLAERRPIEEQRPVQEGDFVLIDYEGFIDGKPSPEAEKTENFLLHVGKGTISNDFDDQLVGMKADESKEVPVTFPKDYSNLALSEKEVTFQVELKEIREEVLPEIDEAFAKRLGNYTTVDELKNEISGNLKQGYEKRIEQELNEQIFKALIERTTFEVPDTLVEMELEGILKEAERSFTMQGISMEDVGINREGLSEQYRDTAEKQVRRHLILNGITKQEALTLSDEALEKGFEDMAEASRQSIESIKEYYEKNTDGLDFFKHTLLEKQAISLIIEQSKVEEMAPDLEQTSPEKRAKELTENNQ